MVPSLLSLWEHVLDDVSQVMESTCIHDGFHSLVQLCVAYDYL